MLFSMPLVALVYLIETASKCHKRQLFLLVGFVWLPQAAQATHVQPAIRSMTVDAAVVGGRKITARFRVL